MLYCDVNLTGIVGEGPIYNNLVLIRIMAWCPLGNDLFYLSMMSQVYWNIEASIGVIKLISGYLNLLADDLHKIFYNY